MRVWVKLALGLFLWFSLTVGTAGHTLGGSPEIWFAPLDPILRPEVGYGGSTEFMNLFQPDAPWPTAAAHIQVFKMYQQWMLGATDADLQRMFADLDRRGIALALEFGALAPASYTVCGRGVEGF